MLTQETKVVLLSRDNSKIKHIWTVLCRRSIIDKESNNISLLDVLEQVAVSRIPAGERQPAKDTLTSAVPLDYELVSLWIRASEDQPALGHARAILCSPSGALPGEPAQIDVDLRVYQRMRTRQRFVGLRIKEPGQYLFRVEYRDDGEAEWRGVTTIPLQVIIEPLPEKQT